MVDQLTRFCVDNPELGRLNELLDEFNLFEAAGLRRDEVKHSRFLSFLLRPRESHGLGESFLRAFLQRELWDIVDAEVLVEWQSIDLLVLVHERRLAVVIENKIGSGEHSDQLNRYLQRVNQQYPGWKVLPLFLSPQGTPPTDDRYLPVTYEVIVGLIDHLLAVRSSSMGDAVRIPLHHYAQLLRRHVVTDSEIRELCQNIYRKHKAAIDLIVEHTGGRYDAVREIAHLAVQQAGFLAGRQGTPTPFLPPSWVEWVPRSSDRAWTGDGWMLLFWFEFNKKNVRLILEIGPGDREIAQRMLSTAVANKPLFDPQSVNVSRKYNRIVRKVMISGASLESEDADRMATEFQKNWERFLHDELGRLESFLRSAVGA